MIEELTKLVNENPSVIYRGRWVTTELQIVVGNDEYRLMIKAGRITGVERGPFLMRPFSIAFRASAEAWEKFWQCYPPPGYQDIFAMTKNGKAEVSGDWRLFMQNLRYFKDLLEAPRHLTKEGRNA